MYLAPPVTMLFVPDRPAKSATPWGRWDSALLAQRKQRQRRRQQMLLQWRPPLPPPLRLRLRPPHRRRPLPWQRSRLQPLPLRPPPHRPLATRRRQLRRFTPPRRPELCPTAPRPLPTCTALVSRLPVIYSASASCAAITLVTTCRQHAGTHRSHQQVAILFPPLCRFPAAQHLAAPTAVPVAVAPAPPPSRRKDTSVVKTAATAAVLIKGDR